MGKPESAGNKKPDSATGNNTGTTSSKTDNSGNKTDAEGQKNGPQEDKNDSKTEKGEKAKEPKFVKGQKVQMTEEEARAWRDKKVAEVNTTMEQETLPIILQL